MKTKSNKNQTTYPQEIRIIGGILKNSKIKFSSTNQLRPTPERLRETLFNWLAHFELTSNTSVLDLFSGTGALGLEALSRGAQKVVFVEKNKLLTNNLTLHLNRLILQTKASYQIESTDVFSLSLQQHFDLILVDPPFSFYENDTSKFLIDLFKVLDQHSHAETFLFLESPFDLHEYITQQCFTWNILRNTKCGQAHALLLQKKSC